MKELQTSEVVEQFLAGLTYPISRENLLDRGDEAKLGDEVMNALAALPSRDYASPAEVTQALNAD
jgi:hypothetical protein